MKSITQIGKKKVSLDEVQTFYKIEDYLELYDVVLEDINKNRLKPVKSAKTNGKSPALPMNYKVIVEEKNNDEILNELEYVIDPILKIDYYKKHMEKYIEDRDVILTLNKYLISKNNLIKTPISLNERSFEIWGKEKYLKENGVRILKNVGLSIKDLNVYETTEPLAYYSHSKSAPQNVLILENKDTFYSMRQHLLDGASTICGIPIGTLIYGGGKKINKAFHDFSFCVEPYLNDSKNTILYFGDFDYEGITIYESLKNLFSKQYVIKPFIEAYVKMVSKAEREKLPDTKIGQKSSDKNSFLESFEPAIREKMKEILRDRKYIPQEILNINDF